MTQPNTSQYDNLLSNAGTASGSAGTNADSTLAANQVIAVPDGYVPAKWIDGFGPISDAQYRSSFEHTGPTVNDPRNPIQALPTQAPYRINDAYTPANNPQDIPVLQQKLIQAGLLDPTQPGYTPGLWGALEVSAYTKVLGNANLYGVDAGTVLDYMLKHPASNLNAVKQVTLTSPVSIQQAFATAVQSALNRKPSSDETARFVTAFQQYENSTLSKAAQGQAAYQMNPATAPKSITGEASPSEFAQQYVDTNYGSEEAGVGYQHGLDLIKSLISSTKGAGG